MTLTAPVAAVTFDVGNTLLPFRGREMEALLSGFAAAVRDLVGPFDEATFRRRYDEVREAQYRENLPDLRENDLVTRVKLTLETVVGRPSPELVADAVGAYLDALAAALPLPDGLPALLGRLKARFPLGVITNYPYAPGTRHVLREKGLDRFFDSVVISADLGFVKPHPLLFRRAARELDVPIGSILHVGDDWEADVIGATRAGAQPVLFCGYREEPDPRRGDPEGRPAAVLDDLYDLLPLCGLGPATRPRAASRE